MERVTIRLKSAEAEALEKIFQKHSIEYSTIEEEDRFLPSPWKELVVSLAPILIKILYDYIRNRKSKTQIMIKTDDISFDLEAKNIKKLELLLDKAKKP